MVASVVVSTLLGAVLGLRYTVVVLFPALLAIIIVITCIVATQGGSVWSALLMVTITAAGLQVGFLGGVAFRHFNAGSRRAATRGAADDRQPNIVLVQDAKKSAVENSRRFPAA